MLGSVLLLEGRFVVDESTDCVWKGSVVCVCVCVCDEFA